MKVTYNFNNNTGYIALREKNGSVQTVQICKDVNIDIAEDGTVFGIELLNANEQLADGPVRKLIVQNATTGASTEVELSA